MQNEASPLDVLIGALDRGLRTLWAPAMTSRHMPGDAVLESDMDAAARAHAAALMRVNHAGEVCAQALYQGQAITSRSDEVRVVLEQAAREEAEHLSWTERRISELGGRTSLLNPIWYAGSLMLGMAAGALGTRWSLGFLAETERQVEAHLTDHLSRLLPRDGRSRAVLRQMREDERRHAETAFRLGGVALPAFAGRAMELTSKVMKFGAYRL